MGRWRGNGGRDRCGVFRERVFRREGVGRRRSLRGAGGAALGLRLDRARGQSARREAVAHPAEAAARFAWSRRPAGMRRGRTRLPWPARRWHGGAPRRNRRRPPRCRPRRARRRCARAAARPADGLVCVGMAAAAVSMGRAVSVLPALPARCGPGSGGLRAAIGAGRAAGFAPRAAGPARHGRAAALARPVQEGCASHTFTPESLPHVPVRLLHHRDQRPHLPEPRARPRLGQHRQQPDRRLQAGGHQFRVLPLAVRQHDPFAGLGDGPAGLHQRAAGHDRAVGVAAGAWRSAARASSASPRRRAPGRTACRASTSGSSSPAPAISA